MEPKHKELLAQCRQSLAQSMTEVDKVIELLEAAGTLSPRDLHELQEAAGGGAGGASKADRLIQLLLAKDRDHFQDLRVALEKTQPHLLSILYLNGVAGAPPGETAGSTYSVLSIMPSDSESSSSLSSIEISSCFILPNAVGFICQTFHRKFHKNEAANLPQDSE